ncbi:hypothetical protein D3C80_2118530 [compost metagenome]
MRIRQACGIAERGDRHAEFAGTGRHLFGKGGFAAGHALTEDDAGIIGELNGYPLEQIGHADA